MSLLLYLQESIQLLQNITLDAKSVSVIEEGVSLICRALINQRTIMVCGNGGSAADAQHITAELVGRYLQERRALKVICLADNPAVLTALANDYGYEQVFARQVEAYGQSDDILIGLSTSGQSKNVVNAFKYAKSLGIHTLAFTGAGGGTLACYADLLIAIPSSSTPQIQQAHLCLYHYFCEQIEHRVFKEEKNRSHSSL